MQHSIDCWSIHALFSSW